MNGLNKEEARARLITMAQNESLGLEREALIIGANALVDNENLWLEAHDKRIRAEIIDEFVKTFCDNENQRCFVTLNQHKHSWDSYAEHIAKQLKEQNK